MQIEHHIHEHPLFQYDLDKEGLRCFKCNGRFELPSYHCPKCNYFLAVYCPLCGQSIGGKTCACKECLLFFHRSCADQCPPKIQHLFHRLHPLSIYYRSTDFEYIHPYVCSACQVKRRCYAYHCADCSFGLCLNCVRTHPSIKFEDGNHLFYLYENTDFDRHCNVCDEADSHTSIFVCIVPKCGYAVHLHCTQLPLPDAAKHRRHRHNLIWTDSVVDEDDDSDEYYCDACEERRDKNHPVYYCKECDFVAHIGCGVSKELGSLVTEYENQVMENGPVRDHYLEKIDEELVMLRQKEEVVRAKLEALPSKLKALEDERSQYLFIQNNKLNNSL